MIKGVDFEWDEQFQNAQKDVKTNGMKPPILISPIKGKPHTVNQRPGLVLGSTMGAGERRTLVREEGMGSPT